MIVAAFHDSAFTRQFALRLRSSVEILGLKCRLFDLTAQKDRMSQPGWKALALLRLLDSYREDNLLLIDPDSVFNRRPAILLDEKDYDVAVHYDVDTMAVSGPLFVRNNDAARRLLETWDGMNLAFPKVPELDNLSSALSQPQSAVEVRRLPVTYAWVERYHRDRHPDAQPVITQFRTDNMITRRIKVQ